MKKTLAKLCKKCDKRYIPDGKQQKICNDCLKVARKRAVDKMKDTLRRRREAL